MDEQDCERPGFRHVSTPKAAATEEQLKAILNEARDAHDVLSRKRSEKCELAGKLTPDVCLTPSALVA